MPRTNRQIAAWIRATNNATPTKRPSALAHLSRIPKFHIHEFMLSVRIRPSIRNIANRQDVNDMTYRDLAVLIHRRWWEFSYEQRRRIDLIKLIHFTELYEEWHEKPWSAEWMAAARARKEEMDEIEEMEDVGLGERVVAECEQDIEELHEWEENFPSLLF